MPTVSFPAYTVEDALARIVAWLRDPNRDPHAGRREGVASHVELIAILQGIVSEEIERHRATSPSRGMTVYHGPDLTTEPGAAPFHEAIWDLCRKGILRPRPLAATPHQAAPAYGWRFDITEYGQRWLVATSGFEALPTEYGRVAELLTRHATRFGAGFASRSQEAVRCYRAHAYLACCVMCGAAAESILLAVAITRTGDEPRVLADYRTGGGRGRVERTVAGQQPAAVQAALTGYTELLKYWRDDAAHGAPAEIDEEEAFTALLLLMRFARFIEDRWSALTGTAVPGPSTVVAS